MGSGAVGGYFGALIHRHTKANVTFIARGDHLDAIRKSGLNISSIDGDFSVEAEATNNVSEIEEADLIIFAVKSYDTEDAIKKITPLVGENTQVLSIQNGLDNHDLLEDAFGEEHVIRGLCVIGAELTEPGHIAHRALGSIKAGEKNGDHNTERITNLSKLFEPIPAELTISDDIQTDIWKKFAWNCVFNVLTGLAHVTVEKLFHTDSTLQLVDDVYAEITWLAAAYDINFTDADYDEIIKHGKSLHGFRTSTYQDVEKGKPLEFEGLTGSLLRRAESKGVSMPVNNALYALFQLREQ